jgi:RNA polymerase sigma factor (sigma-70 family)
MGPEESVGHPISRRGVLYRHTEVQIPPFEQVVESHGRSLLRFCLARAGSDRGEDVFQEAMIAALRAYPELRDPDAVRPWLFAIAARKCVDDARAEARAPVPIADPDAAADQSREAPPFDAAVWAGVRQLPEKQRQAVGLRYIADLSHREIGDVMGISTEASRRNVLEGLRKLRGRFGADLTFSGPEASNGP